MYTLKYTGKRILFMIFTFLIIISVAFILVRLLPNVPAKQFGKDMELVLKSRYRQGLVDLEGNEIPLIQQYFNFFRKTLIGGDWGIGEKMYFGQSCVSVFLE